MHPRRSGSRRAAPTTSGGAVWGCPRCAVTPGARSLPHDRGDDTNRDRRARRRRRDQWPCRRRGRRPPALSGLVGIDRGAGWTPGRVETPARTRRMMTHTTPRPRDQAVATMGQGDARRGPAPHQRPARTPAQRPTDRRTRPSTRTASRRRCSCCISSPMHPLDFRPGSNYQYSNTDNFVVALMAQAVTHTNYASLLKSRRVPPAGADGHDPPPRVGDAERRISTAISPTRHIRPRTSQRHSVPRIPRRPEESSRPRTT